MGVHPKDHAAANPRLQCSACGRWMRLHRTTPHPITGFTQTFFGGCSYTNGGDHLAGKPDAAGVNDVCEECCHVECKRLAGCDCEAPYVASGASLMSEDCPVHKLYRSPAH